MKNRDTPQGAADRDLPANKDKELQKAADAQEVQEHVQEKIEEDEDTET